MNVIAVIPARGGSKRVPRKNIREVGGRPLLAWSIQAAKEAKSISRVIVSTDDEEIASVARWYEAEVSMRPEAAATDDAPIEAALWSVHQQVVEPYDYMVTLQPTVPMRRPGLIDECVERAIYLDADAVFTAREVMRCWLWEETSGAAWLESMSWTRLGAPLQRQQATRADKFWMHDGSVCVSVRMLIERKRDRQGGRAVPFLNESAVDVDTEADLLVADTLLRQGQKQEVIA